MTLVHGTAFDPDDTKLKIYYEFDGVKISSSQMFTAYLDALATAAVHGRDETDAAIIAYSEDRHTSIYVRRDISCTSFTGAYSSGLCSRFGSTAPWGMLR